MPESDESHARDEICRVGRSLFERGYVHASAGTICTRLDDSFLITPTDASLGTLEPARLGRRLDAQGQQVGGDRASKTLALHRRIYEAAPESRRVIHTYRTHLVALTLQVVCNADDILPTVTPYFVMKVGPVPLIPQHRPGDAARADLVAQRIDTMALRGTPIRAVMLERLGPNLWHRSAAEGQCGAGGTGRNREAVAAVPAATGATGCGADRGPASPVLAPSGSGAGLYAYCQPALTMSCIAVCAACWYA